MTKPLPSEMDEALLALEFLTLVSASVDRVTPEPWKVRVTGPGETKGCDPNGIAAGDPSVV